MSCIKSVKARLTIRSTQPATARIFNLGLLATLLVSESNFAHPQAGELMGVVVYYPKAEQSPIPISYIAQSAALPSPA